MGNRGSGITLRRFNKMFVLSKLYIQNKDKVILDTTFSDKENNHSTINFITLIIGENGVGKSFLLKSLVDVFIFLEKINTYHRKPKYKYEKFTLEYYLDNNLYSIVRISGSEIHYYKNNLEIKYEDLVLPSRVLVVSFMVNDKFIFSKNDVTESYRYLGVRSSTNSTYTSSINRKITDNLIKAVNSNLVPQIKDMLALLKFDPYLEIEVTEIREKKLYFKESYIMDLGTLDTPVHIDDSEYNKNTIITIYFKKDNDKITFDLCSSGEKHILFAFTGILSQIRDNSLILIDEPEISLHPEWQMLYITTLYKLFGKYRNCLFVIASHSHYFVSDLKPETSSIIAFYKDDRLSKSRLISYSTYAWSAENIIYNVFGIRTTRNYYFEADLNALIILMEEYSGNEKEKVEIQKLTDKLKHYLYDSKDPLFAVIEQAEELINAKS